MHPYVKYEKTKIWEIVQKEIQELIENQDIELLTKMEYVVGSIVEKLINNADWDK